MARPTAGRGRSDSPCARSPGWLRPPRQKGRSRRAAELEKRKLSATLYPLSATRVPYRGRRRARQRRNGRLRWTTRMPPAQSPILLGPGSARCSAAPPTGRADPTDRKRIGPARRGPRRCVEHSSKPRIVHVFSSGPPQVIPLALELRAGARDSTSGNSPPASRNAEQSAGGAD